MGHQWDVIVIGGGHAGCEAAAASAKLGRKTALLTLNRERVGFMSCNPAMGGLAKGQLIKEIDALGGLMGINTDLSAIQYRRLNESKGPAVRSSRAQCDKAIYARQMQAQLSMIPNLEVLELEAVGLLVVGGRVQGVRCGDDLVLSAKAVVITSGTFLRAIMHMGAEKTEGGRAGDAAAVGLSRSIAELGFRMGRLKTGTPPRLHRDSISYDRVEAQPGDAVPVPFSFYFRPEVFPVLPQLNCWITYTNERTHEIIASAFDRSPMFNGVIEGIGPRYCPSIEDKVNRFRERNRHQIFLEPEGFDTDDIYVNGVSTSLPRDVQVDFIRSINGLENAEFTKFGYAVEYDCIDARQLRATLEAKEIKGLFFAGQINGTSGYEEAGAQGLIAGINSALSCVDGNEFTLGRHDGYIGVLIDDLILRGADEPYRMFTSRAEYRLLLREDNADLRLSPLGREVGLLGDEEYMRFDQRRENISKLKRVLDSNYLLPTEQVNAELILLGTSPLKDRVSLTGILRRPEVKWSDLSRLGFSLGDVGPDVAEQVEIQAKYEGYIRRDLELLEGVKKSENLRIPDWLVFTDVPGLSNEAISRLNLVRPETIGQASRLQGLTPAAIANLLIFMKMRDGHTGMKHAGA